MRNLGLERYEATFRENDVSAEVLCHLTAEDLARLGVVTIGHRRQLLVAITKLNEPDSGFVLTNGPCPEYRATSLKRFTPWTMFTAGGVPDDPPRRASAARRVARRYIRSAILLALPRLIWCAAFDQHSSQLHLDPIRRPLFEHSYLHGLSTILLSFDQYSRRT